MAIPPLKISRLGPIGDGIHESPRGRVFVDRALPGDEVYARVRMDAQGISRGEITEIVKPSPFRQEAPCPHYDVCGNCTLQHAHESFYRAWKSQMVKEAFQKQGLRPTRWLEPVFLGGQNRRRATLSAVKQGHKITVGYYRRRSKVVSDIESCLVADPKILELRDALKPFLVTLLREGKPVDLFLQIVGDAVDLVVTGPINLKHDTLEALTVVGGITRLSWRPSTKDRIKIIAESGPVTATFGKLKVNLPPAAFLQPTVAGEKALVEAVLEPLPEKGNFADLFCGCGTFTGPLLRRGPVEAFDSQGDAVGALTKAAGKLPLKVTARDLFRNPLKVDELNAFDAVIFDPPRAGCEEQAAQMARAKTPLLVGVSCNPATFSRDASLLKRGGYQLQSLQVIDQFVWSHHVEVVGVFKR